MNETEYKPVPVEVARRISLLYQKPIVVIVSVDRVHNLFHFTSYGEKATDKTESAALCDSIAAIIGQVGKQQSFEDFRFKSEAESAETIDKLKREIERITFPIAGSEIPQELDQLIKLCEANQTSFSNDQMSAALHFVQNAWMTLNSVD